MVFAGHDIIAENGSILAESKAFSSGLTIADTDIKKTFLRTQKNELVFCPPKL
jgi:NAD+ synthase (glutamine-hydrolysing)